MSITPNVSSSDSKFSGQCCPQGSPWGRDSLHTWAVGPGRFSELWAASFPSGSVGGVPFPRQLPRAAQLPGRVSLQGCVEMTGKLGVSLLCPFLSTMQRRCSLQQGSSHPSLCHCPVLGQGHPSPCELLSCVGLNLGSYQEGIKVPALPTSSFLALWWGHPSHLPGPPQAEAQPR